MLLCTGEFNRIRPLRAGPSGARDRKRKARSGSECLEIGSGRWRLLALAAALLATCACDKIASKQAIKKGNEFFKAQKYETALANYQEAQRLDPGEVKLKKNIGLAYMGMYQPGSKHAKDLEFAGKAIENLKAYVDRVSRKTRRPGSSSFRCTSRPTATTTRSSSTSRC